MGIASETLPRRSLKCSYYVPISIAMTILSLSIRITARASRYFPRWLCRWILRTIDKRQTEAQRIVRPARLILLAQQRVEAVRGNRQLPHRAGHAERVVDRGGDRRSDRVNAGLARALDPERVQRGRRILEEGHFDGRNLGDRRHQVIGEGDRQRLARRVVDEFLHQRGTNSLNRAAEDLAFDQHRVYPPPDVAADTNT